MRGGLSLVYFSLGAARGGVGGAFRVVSGTFATFAVIPAAFSPRESGEGIQCLFLKGHWVPAHFGN